ncbi:hypothetical protein [Nocardioides terrigena]|uniref:hypothetical protein n=1 Tax=Nocardioides terrigena TaxID=424797 RepID=UPI000D312CFF|nr:hypothetical protein [Nocardioides terrigena]
MSERLLLESFREDAERLTRLPAFELIEAAGRARRRRRHTIGGVVAACLLATTGVVVTTTGDTPDPRPAEDPAPRSLATPWPGPTMTTMKEGTYEFRPSIAPGSPPVLVTLPPGWNAWEGPNRFEGLDRSVTDDADVNEGVIEEHPRWYAGLLVLDVQWVAQRGCSFADTADDDAAALAQTLVRLPGFGVDTGPTSATVDGLPALHLRLRGLGTLPRCTGGVVLHSSHGPIGGGEADTLYDVWVIDTGVSPVLVWAEWSRSTPQRDVDDLLAMVDSVEIGD